MKVRLLLCSVLLLAATTTPAQERATLYPTRPVRLIVPYSTGGNADIMARLLAQRLSERLGQQVVVDNRGGANGIIGTDMAAKSAPDGHTLLFVATAIATNPVFTSNLPFDTLKDLAPITLTGWTPLLLVVSNALAAKSVKEYIALAKAKPGSINYASSGNGSPANLAGELFNLMTGIDTVHVPYKGTAQLITDVIGGQMQSAYPSMTSTLPHVRGGKLRALAMTGAQRSPLAPDIPTVAESGVPGYEAGIWNGVLAPAGTPRAIIERVNRELVSIIRAPDTRERFAALGADPLSGTPEDFGQYIKAEMEKWSKLGKSGRIRIDLR